MYNFIDVTESRSVNQLPSEALCINGTYIEHEIERYQTLYVSGREILENEIEELQIGKSDGSRFQSKRYPGRTIVVGYLLHAKTNEAFREAYNKLNRILDVAEAKLVFNDEPDKYFIGTKQGGGSVPPGVNQVTGEIEFYCADPFKYAVEETEVLPELDNGQTFAVDYNGTYPAYPILEAKISGDNGFIGFLDGDQHILQFGNPDEANGENYKRNEMQAQLPNFTALLNDFGTNFMHPEHSMKGVLLTENVAGRDCMRLSKNGPIQAGKWNGGMKTFVLPPDSEGVYGAKNFYCYLNHWFETGLMGQTACQDISFLTADNRVICGYSIYKTDMTGNTATLEMWANGKVLRTINFEPAYWDSANPFNNGRGHNDIRKEGDMITFHWWGSYPAFKVPEVKDMECHKIQVAFSQYDNRDLGGQYVTCNYVRAINYQKMHVQKWRDVPNKFMGGDTFSADCRKGEVLLRGLPASGLGSLGNDWESFTLKPGANQIRCIYSGWAKQPQFKLKYREVYL